MNEKRKQIAIYQHNFVNDLQEFKKIYEREDKKNNIDKCYYVVRYYAQDMDKFININKCIDYIREDYKNNKDEFNLDLNAYTINLLLETKTTNFKGVIYEYNYNMEELRGLIDDNI